MNNLVPVKNEEDIGGNYTSATGIFDESTRMDATNSTEESGIRKVRSLKRLGCIVLGAILFVLAYYYYNVVEPREAETVTASTETVAVSVEKEIDNQHDDQFNFIVNANDNARISFNGNVVMNVY